MFLARSTRCQPTDKTLIDAYRRVLFVSFNETRDWRITSIGNDGAYEQREKGNLA